MIPERTPALALLIAALIAILAGLWTAIAAMVDLPDTAKAGHTTISVRTPEVAPGDAIAVRVVVRGGKRTAIEEVTVRGGEQMLRVAGRGATWGSSFHAGSDDHGMADRELSVEVPRDAAPGATLALRFEVRSVTAEEIGYGRFRNVSATDIVTVDVPVLTPAQRGRARGLGAALALALMLAAAVAVWFATPPVSRLLRKRPRSTPRAHIGLIVAVAVLLTLTLLVAAIAYGFAGWFYFARRLAASTAIIDAWFAWVCLGAWISIPGIAGLIAAQRVDGELPVGFAPAPELTGAPYRGSAGIDDPPPLALDALLTPLTAAGLAVRRRGRHLTIREGSALLLLSVRDPDAVRAADLSGWTRSPSLALAAALALVPALGPLSVSLGIFGTLTVDGTLDRDALTRNLTSLAQRQIAEMMSRISSLPPVS